MSRTTPQPDLATLAPLLPTSATPGDLQLLPLPGDAGNRRYFRVCCKDTRYILMQMADAEGFKASEEATSGNREAALGENDNPFLNMQRHLLAIGLPVPQVIGTNLDAGLILLEDLGDTSLMAAVNASPDRAEHLYTTAIDHLVTLQSATLGDDCIATHRDYGAELFMWEFDHYVEYGIEALHGQTIPQTSRTELKRLFGGIATGLGGLKKLPVHRDYHSRNIMVKDDGTLGLIDFQDALMGPATYDLASLLWDPYATLPSGLGDRLIRHYVDRAAAASIPTGMDFGRLLALTALQRLLKAAGRFVYIDRVKGNPNFLADIPACLSRARAILSADRGLIPLQTVLAGLEPRLAGK